jgi:hypothetical protein
MEVSRLRQLAELKEMVKGSSWEFASRYGGILRSAPGFHVVDIMRLGEKHSRAQMLRGAKTLNEPGLF